jgi:poly(hydroxyalkanoate) depolymerase family esterase
MAKLADTVARLDALRRAASSASGGRAKAVNDELTRIPDFGPNPGALRMLTHVPKALSKPAPLVVVLHGCTQAAASYAVTSGWTTLAEQFDFAVLAPEQQAENNPNRCFNWFQPQDVRRGSGETASIRSMIQKMILDGSADPGRIYITGLSAGGAMCAAMLAAYPETFAGGAVVAGLPFGAASNLQEALGLMSSGPRLSGPALAERLRRAAPTPNRRLRLAIWHGDADRTVSLSNARALAAQYAAYHALPAEPASVRTCGRRTRSVWVDAEGIDLVELNIVAGLGHGTPVSALGGEPVGQVAAFSLEAGVSSSLEIARFWGLAGAASDSDRLWEAGGPGAEDPPQTNDLADTVLSSVSPHVSDEIQRVIAKALVAAGLKR